MKVFEIKFKGIVSLIFDTMAEMSYCMLNAHEFYLYIYQLTNDCIMQSLLQFRMKKDPEFVKNIITQC